MASKSPASFSCTCSLNRSAWSSASFNSEKPLANSRPPTKNSKRSVTNGFLSLRRARGDTSVGYSVIKVGCSKRCSTVFSKISICTLPKPQVGFKGIAKALATAVAASRLSMSLADKWALNCRMESNTDKRVKVLSKS